MRVFRWLGTVCFFISAPIWIPLKVLRDELRKFVGWVKHIHTNLWEKP